MLKSLSIKSFLFFIAVLSLSISTGFSAAVPFTDPESAYAADAARAAAEFEQDEHESALRLAEEELVNCSQICGDAAYAEAVEAQMLAEEFAKCDISDTSNWPVECKPSCETSCKSSCEEKIQFNCAQRFEHAFKEPYVVHLPTLNMEVTGPQVDQFREAIFRRLVAMFGGRFLEALTMKLKQWDTDPIRFLRANEWRELKPMIDRLFAEIESMYASPVAIQEVLLGPVEPDGYRARLARGLDQQFISWTANLLHNKLTPIFADIEVATQFVHELGATPEQAVTLLRLKIINKEIARARLLLGNLPRYRNYQVTE